MSMIIVAVDESKGTEDAIALASSLANATGSKLMLVNVFPYDPHPSRSVDHKFEEVLRGRALELLERVRSAHAGEAAEIAAVANPSPAHGLHELAEQEDAALIVIGSTHTGRAGRVLPGSTAERLLHGSPCPVGVAPKGYAERSDRDVAVIGCGYDGSAAAQRALEAAHRLAEATGARLRVIRAFEPLAYETRPGTALDGVTSYNDTLLERASEELDTAVAAIGGEPATEAQIAVGDAVQILADASAELTLLLVGSRGYGPLHSVIVGGVSGRLVREAACPMIVFPRGTHATDQDTLFAKASTAQAETA